MTLSLLSPGGKRWTGNPQKDVIARTRGRMFRLGVNQTWCAIFELNEKLDRHPPNNNFRMPYCDYEITNFMMAEFPYKSSAYYKRVHHARRLYNAGKIGCQRGVPPVRMSHRYDEHGIAIVHKRLGLKDQTSVNPAWREYCKINGLYARLKSPAQGLDPRDAAGNPIEKLDLPLVKIPPPSPLPIRLPEKLKLPKIKGKWPKRSLYTPRQIAAKRRRRREREQRQLLKEKNKNQ